MKKIISILLALVYLCASVAAFAADTITIGGLAPLTGAVAVYGVAVQEGANLFVKQLNAKGGILGKEVVIDWQDTKGDVTESINAYNLHFSNKVSAILGPVITSTSLAVADYVGDDGIPMITASATNYDVTTPGNGYNIFRVCMLDPFQGQVMATLAKESLGCSKVAVLYDNADDYSSGIAKAFEEKAIALGMEVVAFEACTAADVDFKAQLTNIASKEPEAILVPMYYGSVALIARQAREVGITVPLLGGDGWDGVLTQVEDDPSALEGCYFVNHYSPADTSEKVVNFLADYEAEYGHTSNAFGALGYDAAAVLLGAIEASGDADDWDAINKALQATKYDGVTGLGLQFDDHGDPTKAGVVNKIVDGNYELFGYVEP